MDIRLREMVDHLADRKLSLDIDDQAKQYLVSIGYSPTYGARPLNRAIRSELLNPLSVMLLSERIQNGEVIRVCFDGPRNRLMVLPNHEGKAVDDMEIDPDDVVVEEMD